MNSVEGLASSFQFFALEILQLRQSLPTSGCLNYVLY
jgi:hypothetical protein